MKLFLSKIFIFLGLIFLLFINNVQAEGTDILMKNNVGNFTISSDTILVGNVSTQTSVKDLFGDIFIDNIKLEQDKILTSLDIRYLSGQIDKKVFGLDDKLNAGNKVFILFKSISEGGLVGTNTQLKIETKNLILTEYGKVSNNDVNTYNIEGKIFYNLINNTNNSEITNNKPKEPQKDIDINLLKKQETGIFEHTVLIIVLSIFILILFIFPNKKTIGQ